MTFGHGPHEKSFWTTLPGVLTGIAALLTAIAGLYAVLVVNQKPKTPPGDLVPPPVVTAPADSKSGPGTNSIVQSTPAGFRVVEVLLQADPIDYEGPCPVPVRLSGRISTVGGRGTVAYRLLGSDESSGPVQSINFENPGSENVQTVVREISGSFSGWEQLQILQPIEMKSDHATFSIRCK